MYYLVRSSDVWWAYLKHALISFSGDIMDLRVYIKNELLLILDDDFIKNICEVTQLSAQDLWKTQVITCERYSQILDESSPQELQSAA